MKTLSLLVLVLTVIIFLWFGIKPAHAEDEKGISIQNIQVESPTIKVGDFFTVTATLVNNSTVPIVLDGGTCVPIIDPVPFFTVIFDNHTKIKYKNLTCADVGLSKILNPGKNYTGTSPESTLEYIATEPGITKVTVTFSFHVNNQTDPTQPNIGHTISKSLLFTIYDSSTRSKQVNAVELSPLKQFKSGISANDVKCKEGMQLVIKKEDGSPACMNPQTAQKLVERGWGWAMQPIDSIKPILPYRIMGLENDTGTVTFGNQTYYFVTPNYADIAYSNPVQISFHEVVFTLFPPGFRGGLPNGDCRSDGTVGKIVIGGGQYYWADTQFSDGTHELLHIFADSQPCPIYPKQTHFSIHTNPQAGLTFYAGKMKLLVSTKNTFEYTTRLNPVIDIISISGTGSPPNPGGPEIQLKLLNIGMKPVTSLAATLVLNNNYTFNFKDVTKSNPLAPNHTASETQILIGAGSTSGISYPLIVTGTVNNEPFSYTLNVPILYTNKNEIPNK